MRRFLASSSAARISADAKLAALGKAQAIVEFEPDGTIVTANESFLALTGYRIEEIVGKKDDVFIVPNESDGAARAGFWNDLRAGRPCAGEFTRVARDGRRLCLHSVYIPVPGPKGAIARVLMIASDVSDRKVAELEAAAHVEALDRSQALIEFALDGTVLSANENFLALFGYSLDDIKGRHHSMFVDPAESESASYASFWEELRAGRFHAGRYLRLGRNGKRVWLQASYNPVFDLDGKLSRVLKVATDITQQVDAVTNAKALIGDNMTVIGREVGRTQREAANAAARVMETAASMRVVATGTEELAASVDKIAVSMMETCDATGAAAQQNDAAADDAIGRLNGATNAMTGIVEMIDEISGQINLLALNATIEAARAGEAGRGFTVVASEVKALAGQASQATMRISDEINGVQTAATTVVGALTAIRDSVEGMRNHITTAASDVKEQSAIMRDMSANMQLVADSVGTINDNMTEIGHAVGATNDAITKTQDAAEALASR